MSSKRILPAMGFTLVFAALTVLLVLGCSSQSTGATPGAAVPAQPAAESPKNASYEIEGRSVGLANGVSEVEAAPGSVSKITTRYFGNEATGDLNGDGTPDVAFLLTQNSGGSGTFYYAVVAVKTNGGYRGTNAVLLGDRVAPQTTQIQSGRLIVNYAERKPGEPMTARPSMGVSKYLKIVNDRLVEVSP